MTVYVFEHVYEKYLQNPKEDVRSPGAEENWGLNSGPLPEHEALLTTSHLFAPKVFTFEFIFVNPLSVLLTAC